MTRIRWLSEQPPDWPEAHLNLIDALRDYIRSDEIIGRMLLDDGVITRERYDRGMVAIEPMRKMLAELEEEEMDPMLDDLRESK